MRKKLTLAVAFLAFLGFAPAAQAAPIPAAVIPAINLDTLAVGSMFAGPLSDVFTTAAPPPPIIGAIVNVVFFDAQLGVYTYTHTVTPTVDGISEFNTAFPVAFFTGEAGYSFSEAAAAGIAFVINLDGDGTLDWEVTGPTVWGAGDPVTFFFRSTKPPTLGDYNLINGEVGTATSFRPVPEPSALLLLGSGLLALGALKRRMGVR